MISTLSTSGVFPNHFSVQIDLEQLVHLHIQIPDRLGDDPTIHLFLTSNPSLRSAKLLPPLGSTDHLKSLCRLISLMISWRRPHPKARNCFWRFGAANWSYSVFRTDNTQICNRKKIVLKIKEERK